MRASPEAQHEEAQHHLRSLLDEASLAWLTALPVGPLSRAQMTALVMMRNGALLTNSAYRASTGGQDSRTATRELKELVDRGVVEQTGTRGTTTYELAPSARPIARKPAVVGSTGRVFTANDRVLKALEDAELSRADLERITGLTREQVRRALDTLRQTGRVAMIGKPRSRSARWVITPEV